jgi:hypothetical protein
VRPLVSIAVERDEADDDGRDWLVTLRRGQRVVVVNRGLGRFSATALAAEITALVHGTAPARLEPPPRRQGGGTIE